MHEFQLAPLLALAELGEVTQRQVGSCGTALLLALARPVVAA